MDRDRDIHGIGIGNRALFVSYCDTAVILSKLVDFIRCILGYESLFYFGTNAILPAIVNTHIHVCETLSMFDSIGQALALYHEMGSFHNRM